jgi:hypothetical protein
MAVARLGLCVWCFRKLLDGQRPTPSLAVRWSEMLLTL